VDLQLGAWMDGWMLMKIPSKAAKRPVDYVTTAQN